MDYKQTLTALEKSYNINKNIEYALLILRKYRLEYSLSFDALNLKKGLLILDERLNANPLDARLILWKSLFEELYGDRQKSKKYLKIIENGTKYYKNNNQHIYFCMLYIKAKFYNDWEKQVKILYSYISEYSISAIFIGDIFMGQKKYTESYEYLTIGFYNGCRNEMLFENLYKYFKMNPDAKDPSKLFFHLIRWCNRQKIDFENLIINQKQNVSVQVKNNVNLAMLIYEKQQDDYLLFKICETLVEQKSTDEKAFYFYSLASKKQMIIANLNVMLIEAAFKNNYENISYFFMKTFLKDKIPSEMQGFIYYLLLSKVNLSDLIEQYDQDIFGYGKYAIKNKLYDKYSMTIFSYILVNITKFEIEQEIKEQMENIIFERLFLYKIKVEKLNISHIIIKENEKKDCSQFIIKNQTSIISACSSEFSYYFFDNGMKNIIKDYAIIEPVVYNLDIGIYLYFFNQGKQTQEILITLSNYCINNNINKKMNIEILQKTLKLDNLTEEYTQKLKIFLGSVFMQMRDYKNAIAYFDHVNLDGLTGNFIEKILVVYLECKDYKKAINLLVLVRRKISDSIIIYGLEKLIQNKVEIYLKEVSNIAYEMILKGNFNLQLVNITLNYYSFTHQELLKFYYILDKKNIFNNILAEKIIYSSIKNRELDENIETIFLKLYARSGAKEILNEYIQFVCYCILVAHYNPVEKTVSFLEQVINYNKEILYILSSIYYKNSKCNEEIIIKSIEEMEKNNILFPFLKKSFFQRYNSSYINKYQPFIYYSEKGKEILLYYKIDQESNFKKMKMKYYKFGIYLEKIILFYNEQIEYYFEEELESGSILSKKQIFKNENNFLKNNPAEEFDFINNSLILANQYKFSEVERIIISLSADINERIFGDML